MNNLKKIDISKKISNKTGLPITLSSKILENFIDIIIEEAKFVNFIKIKNFGTFKINDKNERIGRNPKNKKTYLIKKRKTVTFKLNNFLRDKLNRN